MVTDTSASSTRRTPAYGSIKRLWQRWQVQGVLLLVTLCLFGLAIAIDSFQAAIAVNMMPPSAIAHPPTASRPSQPSPRVEAPFSNKTYLEFDAKRAQRLAHSELLKPTLTRNRLTNAHLFTTLVR